MTFKILGFPPEIVLWEETHLGVEVTDGLFSVNLGLDGDPAVLIPDTAFDSYPRTLTVTVGGEMVASAILTSSPFAFRSRYSDHVESLDGSSGGVIDGNVEIVGTLTTGTTQIDQYEFPDTKGSDGQIMKTDASGKLYWETPDDPLWQKSGNWLSPISFNDSVGVGISNPQSKFHVRGMILADVYEAQLTQVRAIYGDAHNNDIGDAIGVYGLADNSSSTGAAYGGYFVSAANEIENGPRYGVLGRAMGKASSSGVGNSEYGVRGEATGYSGNANTYGIYGNADQFSSGSAWGGSFTAIAHGTGAAFGSYSKAFSSPSQNSYGAWVSGVSNNSTAAYGCWVEGDNSAGGPEYGGYFVADTAGLFQGDVKIIGTLSKSAGSFMIDHPLDPSNKYLYHSFVIIHHSL
jgi:hypothetical protein